MVDRKWYGKLIEDAEALDNLVADNAALRRQVEVLRQALEYVASSFYAYLHNRGKIEGEDGHPDGGYWDSIRMARAALVLPDEDKALDRVGGGGGEEVKA